MTLKRVVKVGGGFTSIWFIGSVGLSAVVLRYEIHSAYYLIKGESHCPAQNKNVSDPCFSAISTKKNRVKFILKR